MIKFKTKTTLLTVAAAILMCPYGIRSYNVSAATVTSSIASSAVSDATKPSNNLVVSVIAHDNNNITLAWEKPADYSTIANYNIYMNGKFIGNANNNTASQSKQYTDNFYNDTSNSSAVKTSMHNYIATGLTPNTAYSFVIKAVDTTGNVLSQSSTIVQSTDQIPTIFNVTSYGAVGDGTTIDTNAIQAAINACTSGGEVLIPAGKTFKSGSLWLKDNMILRVDGELLGSDNSQDYISSAHPVSKGSKNNALINAVGTSSVQSLKIIGTGIIDGSGWKQGTPQAGTGFPVALSSSISTVKQNGDLAANQYNLGISEGLSSVQAYSTRSVLLSLSNISNVYLGDGLSFENPAQQTMQTAKCNNMVINGALVKTYGCNNADGIDYNAQGLIVMNSVFDTGDDDVNFSAGRGVQGEALPPVSNIWIFDNYFAHGHGAVVAGSYTAAGIDNILAEDNVINGTGSGLRCKSAQGIGGGAQNIYFRDSALKNITDGEGQPFIFTSAYTNSSATGSYTSAPDLPIFKHIFVSNCSVNGSKSYGIFVDGLNGGAHTDIHFNNVSFANTLGASLTYMTNSTFTNITFKGMTNPWTLTNCTNVTY
ncbi:glycosyl hydrolase family 28 protein [Clostridium akagii]|uniref:glycosyl hydrolase family 28 protein n=1 Tax=Clostridium akagii TaxID=91623 RepID=UPI0005644E35|nr:glycosyl hydrolase family 28 protein [Clostridium akagii]